MKLRDNFRIKIMKNMADSLNLSNVNILDIGCYDGTFLPLLKKNKNKYYGIDSNNRKILSARKRGIISNHFVIDGKTKLPFNNGFFSLVIAGEIIEHIYDTDFLLKEIYRILSKKGYLLISTPNIASLGRRLMLLFGVSPIIETTPNEINSSGHIRYFTFKTLKKLLNKHNFKILQSTSDLVNFTVHGNIKSTFVGKIFPKIGQSIIYLAIKI